MNARERYDSLEIGDVVRIENSYYWWIGEVIALAHQTENGCPKIKVTEASESTYIGRTDFSFSSEGLKEIITSNKRKKKETKPDLTIQGYKPHAIIKIGCVEIPVNGARKLANRLLAIAKKAGDDKEITIQYKGNGISRQDIETFITFLDKEKL